MKRFIFVSFGFLAFAFYELSGGADFQPRLPSIPAVATIVTTEALPVARPVQVKAASLIASPAVTVIRPTPAQSAPAPTPVAFVTIPRANVGTLDAPDQPLVDQTRSTTIFPNSGPITQPLVLASLEQGILGLQSAPPVKPVAAKPVVQAAPPADIREITASRVNMRDGPGTTYPVLTRLTLGHTVEILDDSGNGWLRLRTLPEQRIGWISASLVSKAKR